MALEETCHSEDNLIMGLRHRQFTVEGVQFHPESIASECGDSLFRNFLSLSTGSWAEEDKLVNSVITTTNPSPFIGFDAQQSIPSYLENIVQKRRQDVTHAKSIHGKSLEDAKIYLSLSLAPPLINTISRIRQAQHHHPICFMGEIKRASPSRGIIKTPLNAVEQSGRYLHPNLAVISILTEPKFVAFRLSHDLSTFQFLSRLHGRLAIGATVFGSS